MDNNTNKQNSEVAEASAPKGIQTNLTPKQIKAIRTFAYNIKNSGMNPWGNQRRGKDVRELHMGKSKKSVFNKEDAVGAPKLEKIQKNNRR